MDDLTDHIRSFRIRSDRASTRGKGDAHSLLLTEIRSSKSRRFRQTRAGKAVASILAALLVGSLVAISPLGAAIGDQFALLPGSATTHPGFKDPGSRDATDLGVLVSPVTSPTQLTRSILGGINAAIADPDITQMRFGVTSPGKHDIMVLASPRIVCLGDDVHGDGGGTCATPADALSGKLWMVTSCESGLTSGRVRITGLVPNGVDQVLFDSTGDGKIDRTARVTGNVYDRELPPVTTAIRFEPEGPPAVTLDLPGMALGPGETCAA